jgi:hypothetical protein
MLFVGRPFTMVTDHRALRWMLILKEPSAKLTRWALRLAEFQYKVIHRPGKQHIVPDVLSRHVAAVHTREEGQIDRAIIKAEQDADTFSREIRSKLNTLSGYIEDQDELLYKRAPRGQLRLIIPKGLVTRIIRQHHDSRYAAHAGIRKT